MRAKDVAFIADVLANEARHAMPDEVAGLMAAVGALTSRIVAQNPDVDVDALRDVHQHLRGAWGRAMSLALSGGMCRVCGWATSNRAHVSDGMCERCRARDPRPSTDAILGSIPGLDPDDHA